MTELHQEHPLIREMAMNDLADVKRIYDHAIQTGTATAHRKPLSLDYHAHWLELHQKESNPVVVAELDRKCVGWNALSHYRKGREALEGVRETSYYVDPDFHRRGIASMLMEEMIGRANEMKVHTLLSFIMDGNDISKHIMQKFGFHLWGRLPGILIVDGERRDHLIYGKKL